MRKRILSILLTLCMAMCAVSSLMIYADPGTSDPGAYGALLKPDTNPPAGWEEDASNPYGTKKGQPFAITPWYEPIIYSYRNAENEAAKDHSKVYDKLTLGKNIIESPSGTYNISSVDNVAFAVGTAYDPLGTGRNDHAIFVGLCDMDNKNLTAKVCYWVQNLVTNKRSDLQKIADAPKWACKDTKYGELEYQEFRHYFNVTAGDYDGDGKMTAVITYVGNDDLWGIAGTGIAGEQGLSRKSFVKSKGDDNAYFDGWNTTLYERDQITKSLASADIDRDGCDELFVYAGVAEPDKIDGKDKELSSDSFRKAVSKLSVYKAESVILKRIDQKSLMTLNREDEKADGSRYYDHIRYGNIAAGDIDGDGWQEIVVAGYYREVREEKQKGFIWDKKTDGDNMGFAVYYGHSKSITSVQKTSMSSYTANGTNDLGVKPKPAMTSVAINGRGTPEQVWIAGGLYEVQQNGALNLLCDTTREKNSSAKWWWYQDVIAGNFDHNTEGREQVIALAAERQNNPITRPNARKFDLFTDVFYGENFGSGALSTAGKYTATAEKDEYSKLCHDADLAWDMPHNCILLAGDVNKDGLFARYEGKGYGYSDAQVQAVLQAAPYFAELGDYDLDFSDGSTTYTFSSGYSDTKSSSHNTSFGASIVVQGDLKVWRYEATLGYTMDFTKSTEDTLSKEYSASFNAGGNDSVVLYRVPATTYYYSLYDPQKGDFDLSEKNTIALMIPGQPVYTMLDREYYDEFAVLYNETYKADIAAGKAKALPILNGNVLPEDAEGDPFAYWSNTDSAADYVSQFESLSKQKYELGFGASSITNDWTVSSEHAEGVEMAHGFSASMKSTWGADYFNMGFAIDFSYSNATGTVYTTTESSGASGTVNNIDRRSLLSSYGIGYDVSSQYGFTWDFGMRTWTAGDQKIPVFGYVLTNLRAAPPIPTLTGVSVTNQTAKITWDAPKKDIRRPFAGYHIWMRMDDGEFERVTETPLSSETLSYTYPSLKADTTYTFAVASVGSNGLVSALSNTKTFSTFAGADGREIEFRSNGSSIQWRYAGESDDAYRDLVSLAELTGNDGADGKQIELRVYNGFVQWKYSDDSVWNNLIALSELKGEKGDKGDTGDKGDKGDPGQDGKDGITPRLKIGEDNLWYVSYDGGQTWVSLGVKATGEKGDTGKDGQQGEKGDKGDKGDPGDAGTPGQNGKNGTNGVNGASGADGKNGKDGKDGIGIAKAEINADGELVITYTDGKTVNLGKVVGADGKDGLTPFIGENGNWWIGEKDTGVKAAAEAAVPAGSGNISASAASPALIAIGIIAGLALLGNLGLILYIVLKKKKNIV